MADWQSGAETGDEQTVTSYDDCFFPAGGKSINISLNVWFVSAFPNVLSLYNRFGLSL